MSKKKKRKINFYILKKKIFVKKKMLFVFLFFIFSSFSLTFKTFKDRLDIISTDYPTILNFCVDQDKCNSSSFTSRVIDITQENWTFVDLHIVLKNAEGFVVSDQIYRVNRSKELLEEEGKENLKINLPTQIPTTAISVSGCLLLIFGFVYFFKWKAEKSKTYIPNKQKDRELSSEFYQ